MCRSVIASIRTGIRLKARNIGYNLNHALHVWSACGNIVLSQTRVISQIHWVPCIFKGNTHAISAPNIALFGKLEVACLFISKSHFIRQVLGLECCYHCVCIGGPATTGVLAPLVREMNTNSDMCSPTVANMIPNYPSDTMWYHPKWQQDFDKPRSAWVLQSHGRFTNSFYSSLTIRV